LGSVSVVIPARNSERYIVPCLESILSQALKPDEVILVDDGSSDSTVNVVKERFAGVKCIPCRGRGASAARNTGVEAATGEFISFLDADDVATPWKLKEHVDRLDRNSRTGFVFGPASFIDSEGRMLGGKHEFPEFDAGRFFGKMIVRNRIASTSCVTARRDLLREAGGFDERLVCNEEYDLWLRLLRRTGADYSPRVAVRYRRHEGNISLDMKTQTRNEAAAVGRLPEEVLSRELRKAYGEAGLLKAKARVLLKMEAADAARNCLKGYLAETEEDSAGWFLLGNACALLGFLSEAEGAYRRSLALAPECAAAKNNLAVVLYRKGNRPASAALLEEACRDRPGYFDARRNARLCAQGSQRELLRLTMRILRRQLVPIIEPGG